jgi:hypothetical protein
VLGTCLRVEETSRCYRAATWYDSVGDRLAKTHDVGSDLVLMDAGHE